MNSTKNIRYKILVSGMPVEGPSVGYYCERYFVCWLLNGHVRASNIGNEACGFTKRENAMRAARGILEARENVTDVRVMKDDRTVFMIHRGLDGTLKEFV